MADEKDLNREEQGMTVALTLSDNTEIERMVLTIFDAREHEYTTLLPVKGIDSRESEAHLYRCSKTGDGTPNLNNVEDDDEYEVMAETFDGLLDAQGYDGLAGEAKEG